MTHTCHAPQNEKQIERHPDGLFLVTAWFHRLNLQVMNTWGCQSVNSLWRSCLGPFPTSLSKRNFYEGGRALIMNLPWHLGWGKLTATFVPSNSSGFQYTPKSLRMFLFREGKAKPWEENLSKVAKAGSHFQEDTHGGEWQGQLAGQGPHCGGQDVQCDDIRLEGCPACVSPSHSFWAIARAIFRGGG